MGYNARLHPYVVATNFGSIATGGSALNVLFNPNRGGMVIGARFVNGATSSVASGTTAGSALNVYVYKTASDTSASAVASARLGEVATLATAAVGLATSTALTRFSAGDVYCAELSNGAGNERDNDGCVVQIAYMYAFSLEGTATP